MTSEIHKKKRGTEVHQLTPTKFKHANLALNPQTLNTTQATQSIRVLQRWIKIVLTLVMLAKRYPLGSTVDWILCSVTTKETGLENRDYGPRGSAAMTKRHTSIRKSCR
jgi:hypothetical protein